MIEKSEEPNISPLPQLPANAPHCSTEKKINPDLGKCIAYDSTVVSQRKGTEKVSRVYCKALDGHIEVLLKDAYAAVHISWVQEFAEMEQPVVTVAVQFGSVES